MKPPHEQLTDLLERYQAGHLESAEHLARSMIRDFPRHELGWKVLGAVLKQTGRVEESLVAKQKSVELVPLDAEAHNNLGITFQELGRSVEAEESFLRAIALKPDLAEAHNNLGITLQEGRRSNEACVAFRQAILLRPDFAEAHCNLAATLQSMGLLDEAECSYEKASEANPDMPSLLDGVASLMQFYSPKSQKLNSIAVIQNQLQRIVESTPLFDMISDNHLADLVNTLLAETRGLGLAQIRTQIFRYGPTSLNCERHKAIFDEFEIIPEFCFGCYKVEIAPRSVLELLKLYLVFDRVHLPAKNTRKCMIEVREDIQGFYKGLIYCSNRAEAFEIASLISKNIVNTLGTELPVLVKRGCSEYAVAFPDYKQVNQFREESFKYDPKWKIKEIEFDTREKYSHPIANETFPGIKLIDVLVMRTWIAYADGIGDPGAELFRANFETSNRIHAVARRRVGRYPFTIP